MNNLNSPLDDSNGPESPVRETIAIVGAGICGLCCGLALAKSGHQVTIYERDVPLPSGDPDDIFFSWTRRGASQFRHPHAFLAVMSNLLEEQFPDLMVEFFKAGARKIAFQDMLTDKLKEKYTPLPGDENLWLMMCRRATMEMVLRRYADKQPNLDIQSSTRVNAMISRSHQGSIEVMGLKIQKREAGAQEEKVYADIVIDAGGRNSKFKQWFRLAGAPVVSEQNSAEIVYYTRHYQFLPGNEEPPRSSKTRSAGDLGYLKYGVFPGDSGHFAVIICVPLHEKNLHSYVKDGEDFDRICSHIPGLKPWVDSTLSKATTASFGMGNIKTVWNHFVKNGTPLALNYFAIGDAALYTNPLYGRGCSTGIIHSHLLNRVFKNHDDPVERALVFDQWTERELRPIFKASLNEDKNGIKRAKAVLEGRSSNRTRGFKSQLGLAFGDALARASQEQIHVLRGALKTFNLMEKPGEFLKDWRIRLTILRYMLMGRNKNASNRIVPGPTRTEMLALMEDDKAA
ncbi:MAG: NAD(P)-binding protein [Gammaproteobacteria bacterium]|jgi:2-polyprenyl-6-methoxyphenol hydroxylase-like FAD-dependent oxidoreductase|nr:NAD(P)-binding protein [Gammaproteobacteria bacterium]MBT5203270.1 NAD(P)-binding protein [Gammaproteobacteria bacterium]MBT5604206.1 NAD(P)-binding protein [Gammaproteobacteria bacterium]MBT6244373.1 NAD(P)-binding protein [Gammaproteobacteria bacterium]